MVALNEQLNLLITDKPNFIPSLCVFDGVDCLPFQAFEGEAIFTNNHVYEES